MKRDTQWAMLILSVAMLMTLIAYWPGLSGGFYFDDFSNIVSNEKLRVQELTVAGLFSAAYSGDAGPLGRPVAMLSFALNHYLSGLDSRAFKVTNLVFHLVGGLFLFLLTRNLVRAAAKSGSYNCFLAPGIFSAIVASAWLLHPLHVSTVLYTVQRMAELSALFLFIALWLYLSGRLRQLEGKGGTIFFLTAFLVFFPLSVLSKENGILFPVYLFLIEWIVLQFRMTSERYTFWFRRAVISIATVSVLFVVGYLLVNPEMVVEGYSNRDFSLEQRLLTEARALFFYMSLILLPVSSRMGLYHDDFPLSHGLLDPATTIISVVGLVVLVLVAFRVRRNHPLVAFGLLFFLGGHLLESSVFPLEPVFEHRNYLPAYGIIISVFALLFAPNRIFTGKRNMLAIAGSYILVIAFVTFSRAVSWGNPATFALLEAAHHPESPRAQYQLGRFFADLLDRDPSSIPFYPRAVALLEKSSAISSSFNDGLFRLLPLSYNLGSDISDEWLDELEKRLSAHVFPANNVNMLNWLAGCDDEDRSCKVPPEIVERLLNASLKNPRLNERARSELLVVASKFFLQKRNDTDTALLLIARAAENQPENPRYRIYLARLLLNLGRAQDAASELHAAEQKDIIGIYSDEIEKLQRLAKSMMKKLQDRGSNAGHSVAGPSNVSGAGS